MKSFYKSSFNFLSSDFFSKILTLSIKIRFSFYLWCNAISFNLNSSVKIFFRFKISTILVLYSFISAYHKVFSSFCARKSASNLSCYITTSLWILCISFILCSNFNLNVSSSLKARSAYLKSSSINYFSISKFSLYMCNNFRSFINRSFSYLSLSSISDIIFSFLFIYNYNY